MSKQELADAVRDFQKARQQAGLQRLFSRWTGRSFDLLSYEEVRSQLRAFGKADRGLKDIPLDAIVGSVGRYRDFTRSFLPRFKEDQARWTGVRVAQVRSGLPPISVYQIGDAYFVLDGNHRVSVARQMGSKFIEAYVTEVRTKVPLSPEDQPDDIILKAEYADFLIQTQLDVLRPDVDLSITAPGKYPLLLEHIEVHRYYMGAERGEEVPYEEAVVHWCDEVYRPVVRLIREAGLINSFPDRTEADMYVWLAEHRAEIEEMLGWEIPTATAVADLAATFESYKPHGILNRALSAVIPGSAEPSTEIGQWRRERMRSIGHLHFVRTMLVPISGDETGWQALDQAVVVAAREDSHIFGLFAVAEAYQADRLIAQLLESEFDRRCTESGVEGTFIVEVGDFEHLVSKRVRWADVLVLQTSTIVQHDGKNESLYRRIVRNASGPIFIVPGDAKPIVRALLAFDDRPASREALYVATYLCQQWQIPIVALHVNEDKKQGHNVLKTANDYIEVSGVQAVLLLEQGDVPTVVLQAAATHDCDLIIMGSPSLNPKRELMVGSTVDKLLTSSPVPLLLCR